MSNKRSMFLDPDTFDVCVLKRGSGYEVIHVQVKNWMFPHDDKNKILISRDALSMEEFDGHIDELIELLNELRVKGKQKLVEIENRKRNPSKVR